jgi:hypothetical protein
LLISFVFVKGERINNSGIKDDIRDVIKGVKETAIQSQGVIGALFAICNILLINHFYLLNIDNKPFGFIFNCFILCIVLTIMYALIILFVAFVPRLARSVTFTI